MPPAMKPTMPNLTASPVDFPEPIILFFQRRRVFFLPASISIIFLLMPMNCQFL
jgi:hypothetical protein